MTFGSISRHIPVYLLLATACGIGTADTAPLVVAHRAAPSHWPENSRSAVRESLERGYPAIEIDIVLTSDGVPVIAHDPWLEPDRCTLSDGKPFGERILVAEISSERLLDYKCGGIPDPEFPDAQVLAEPLLQLDELIEAVRDYPETWIQLDVKYEPGLTPPPEVFAEEILGRWTTSGLENPWYVSANLPELLVAFRDWMDGDPITTILIYPRFPPDSDSTRVALGTELLGSLGIRDALGTAKRAEADGIAWPFEIIDWHAARAARDSGLQVMVWTVNEEKDLDRFCRWPIDALITDFPERAPCLPR